MWCKQSGLVKAVAGGAPQYSTDVDLLFLRRGVVVRAPGAGGVPKGTIAWSDFADFWSRLCALHDSESSRARELLTGAAASSSQSTTSSSSFVPPVLVAARTPQVAARTPQGVSSGVKPRGKVEPASRAALQPAQSWKDGAVPLVTTDLWDPDAAAVLKERHRLSTSIEMFRCGAVPQRLSVGCVGCAAHVDGSAMPPSLLLCSERIYPRIQPTTGRT